MGFVKKAVGGIGKALGGIAKVASAALDIAKFIPGIGQIAGAIKFGLNFVKNAKSIFTQGFPAGLLNVAKMAMSSFMPGPFGKISSFLTEKMGTLNSLIPQSIQKFVPTNSLPVVKDLQAFVK